MQPRVLLTAFAVRLRCWLMVSLLVYQDPRSFSAELSFKPLASSIYWCLGLFLPRCRSLHFVELLVIALGPFCPVLNGSITIWFINRCSQFSVVCNLLMKRYHIIQVKTECDEQYLPQYQPLRVTLVTCLLVSYLVRCSWFQASGPSHLASFQSTWLSSSLTRALSACVWGCYETPWWKPSLSNIHFSSPLS